MKTRFIDNRLGSPVEVAVVFHRYVNNDRIAMSLQCCDTGEPWCMATLNFKELDALPADLVAIKNYSENAGLVPLLIEQGILQNRVVQSVQHGHGITTGIYALTPSAYELANKNLYRQ